jgi:predicted NAD/FAD-binding protein
MFDKHSADTQPDLPGLNGINNTWFCGSYFRYGFHEDAVMSAVAVGKDFGITL